MGVFNLFGKHDVSSDITKGSPYRLATEWVPYRLYANKKSSSTLVVRIRNTTNEPLMTSIVVELPKQLGFESIGMTKEREIRLGDIPPNDEKEARFEIFSGLQSDSGEYTLSLTAIAHYRDYAHVLNAVKKKVIANVV